MKNNKKAQTALEFLMTYGWALLIILVILVVAWQWGLFNPRTVKRGSAGFWGLVPGDFAFTSGGTLKISLENQIGSPVNITTINVTIENENTYVQIPNVQINPGENYNRDFTGFSSKPAGSKFEGFISIEYIDDRTGETYRSSGKIWGGVEEV